MADELVIRSNFAARPCLVCWWAPAALAMGCFTSNYWRCAKFQGWLRTSVCSHSAQKFIKTNLKITINIFQNPKRQRRNGADSYKQTRSGWSLFSIQIWSLILDLRFWGARSTNELSRLLGRCNGLSESDFKRGYKSDIFFSITALFVKILFFRTLLWRRWKRRCGLIVARFWFHPFRHSFFLEC